MSLSSRLRRHARRPLLRHAIESLELRTHLTGSPTVTWDFDAVGVAPTVRVNTDGAAWATGGTAKFRGLNLTTSSAANALPYAVPTLDSLGHQHFAASSTAATMPTDGNYEFRLSADALTPNLAQEVVVDDFFLGADFNHTRAVDFDDLLIYSRNQNGVGNKSFALGDATGEGNTTFDDLLAVSRNYNKRLAAAPSYAGQVTAGSEPLTVDTNETDGTRTPLVVTFSPVATVDDPTTPTVEAVTIAGYSIFRSTDGNDFTKVGSVTSDGRTTDYTFTDGGTGQPANTGPVDGVKYWYRIRPYYNVTLPNNTAGIQHLPTTNKVWKVADIAGPTSLLAMLGSTSGSVKLNWNDGTQHETGYRVYEIGSDGVTRTLRATVPANTTSATISGLNSDAAYHFAVVAYTPGIESMPQLVEVAAGLAITPTNAAAANHVTWSLPANYDAALHDTVLFTVERKVDGGQWAAWQSLVWEEPQGYPATYPYIEGTSFDDTDVVAGSTYKYRLTSEIYSGSTSISQTTIESASHVYQPQAVWSTMSTTATLTWPDGSTPPGELILTATDPDTNQTITQTVEVEAVDSGAAGGSGKFTITGLSPSVEYLLDFAPTLGGTGTSAGAVTASTKVFDDQFDLWPFLTNYSSGSYRDDHTYSLVESDLGDHSYVRMAGSFQLRHDSPPAGIPGSTGTPKTDQQAADDWSVELEFGGETFTFEFAGPLPTVGGPTIPFDTGWIEHKANSLEMSITASGMGAERWTQYLPLGGPEDGEGGVEAGTPIVGLFGNPFLDEIVVDIPNWRVQRLNEVAENVELSIPLEWTGSASRGFDFDAPDLVTIEAFDTAEEFQVESINDHEIEANEWFDVTFGGDDNLFRGFGGDSPTIKGGVGDDETLVVLVSGWTQNGNNDDPEEELEEGNEITEGGDPSNGAGIRELKTSLESYNFHMNEINMFSADGGVDGNPFNNTSESSDRVVSYIRSKLHKINVDTRPGESPRRLQMAMAGYSMGAGLVYRVTDALFHDGNDVGTEPDFEYRNFDIPIAAYIDAVELGEENFGVPETRYPVGVGLLLHYFQNWSDGPVAGSVNGAEITNVPSGKTIEQADLDRNCPIELWGPGGDPGTNGFTHYDRGDGRRVIDGYAPLMELIASKFSFALIPGRS